MAENEDVICFEEGMSWLPSHVVEEACHHHHYQQKILQAQFGYPRSRQHRPMPYPNYSRCSERTRHPLNWAAAAVAGGQGMQAIFLDSGRSCSGTGVFLPRQTGANGHYASTKHVRPPPSVLLPDRVVQALNLNVHELGMENKLCRDNVKNIKGNKDCNNRKKTSDCHSPDIFLPKEWTY
nr:Phosphoglycerate mutase [Ipomoea batatas]